MDKAIILPILNFLHNNCNAEIISILMIASSGAMILLLLRFFGLSGLYIYNVVAIIASNIQVLRTSYFAILPEKVALGTIVFASSFLASNLISTYYGKEKATRSVMLSFGGQISFTILMLLSLGYQSSPDNITIEHAMHVIFIPSFRFLIASVIAFLLSQYLNIYIFAIAGNIKFVWVRNSIASLIAGFVDTFLFSYLAWILLNEAPISMHSLFSTYIFGAYLGQIFVYIASIPIVYFATKIKIPSNNP